MEVIEKKYFLCTLGTLSNLVLHALSLKLGTYLMNMLMKIEILRG